MASSKEELLAQRQARLQELLDEGMKEGSRVLTHYPNMLRLQERDVEAVVVGWNLDNGSILVKEASFSARDKDYYFVDPLTSDLKRTTIFKPGTKPKAWSPFEMSRFMGAEYRMNLRWKLLACLLSLLFLSLMSAILSLVPMIMSVLTWNLIVSGFGMDQVIWWHAWVVDSVVIAVAVVVGLMTVGESPDYWD